MYKIVLLGLSVKSIHFPIVRLIECLGSDATLKLDGRIKRLSTVHEKAFEHADNLSSIRKYAGFNVYKNDVLIERHKFADYADYDFKV